MNEHDIKLLASLNHQCQNVRKAANLLSELVDKVNSCSDGWAYWSPPRKSTERLVALLRSLGSLWSPISGKISDKQLRDAVSPIRRMVTVQSKKQKQFGNDFSFDVDSALDPVEYHRYLYQSIGRSYWINLSGRAIRNTISGHDRVVEGFNRRDSGKFVWRHEICLPDDIDYPR